MTETEFRTDLVLLTPGLPRKISKHVRLHENISEQNTAMEGIVDETLGIVHQTSRITRRFNPEEFEEIQERAKQKAYDRCLESLAVRARQGGFNVVYGITTTHHAAIQNQTSQMHDKKVHIYTDWRHDVEVTAIAGSLTETRLLEAIKLPGSILYTVSINPLAYGSGPEE